MLDVASGKIVVAMTNMNASGEVYTFSAHPRKWIQNRQVYLPIITNSFGLEDINAYLCNKNKIMEIIRRQMYLDHIISVMNKNMMLVLVG